VDMWGSLDISTLPTKKPRIKWRFSNILDS